MFNLHTSRDTIIPNSNEHTGFQRVDKSYKTKLMGWSLDSWVVPANVRIAGYSQFDHSSSFAQHIPAWILCLDAVIKLIGSTALEPRALGSIL